MMGPAEILESYARSHDLGGRHDLAATFRAYGSSFPRPGEEERLRALREIKWTALTETSSVRALHHIVRLCIDAGVTEDLAALRPTAQEGEQAA